MDVLFSPQTISRDKKNLSEKLRNTPNAVTKYANYVEARPLDR